jgi:cytoskeletal protein RodZ
MKKRVLQHNREQAERLAEMGMRLRELRQEKKIPLEEVAGRTRIQPRLLRAIEQGRLDELPEAVYIHSFLRQYANAIGLNGVQFASEFPTILGLPAVRSSWRSLPGAQLRPMHLYLLYMFLIIAAVNGLSFLMNRSAQSPVATIDAQKLQPIPAVTVGPVSPAQSGTTGAAKSKAKLGSQDSIRIGVTMTDQSWIRVVADGKTEFEGVLPEGTQKTWTAAKQVVIRAGNAGGVLVAFNEGQATVLGQPGAIGEKIFPPDARFATLPDSTTSSESDTPNSP